MHVEEPNQMIIASLEEAHQQDFISLYTRYGHSMYEDFPKIRKNQALLYEANRLLASNRNGDTRILVALDDQRVVGTVVHGNREWDTRHFGFKVGAVWHIATSRADLKGDSLPQEILLASAIQDLEDLQTRCIICRINSNEDSLIHTLERYGFLLMDTLVTFFIDTYNVPKTKKRYTQIKPHRKSDTTNLIKIATNTFETGHFFADRRFPIVKCHQLYGKWIEKACNSLTDVVLVAYVNEKPIGFIACRKDEDASDYLETNIGIIDLIAVSRDYQGQGIGLDLIISSLKWFKRNRISLARIGTHLSNRAGIRLNLKAGFKYAASESTFHGWI